MSSTGNTSSVSEAEYKSEASLILSANNDVEVAKQSNFENIDPQHKAFALEYLINGFKHREAAKAVGLSPNSGLRLRRLPVVNAYINYLQEKQIEDVIVSQTFIDAKLDDLYDMAIGDVEVPLVDSDGQEFRAKKFNGNLALSILQEKNKMHGHVKPDIGGGGGGVNVIIDMGAALGEPENEAKDVTAEVEVINA